MISVDRIAHGDITITRVHPTDCDHVLDAVRTSLPELIPWAGWAHSEYSRHDAANFVSDAWLRWNEGRAYNFAVRRAGDPRILGLASLDEISPVRRDANPGYWTRSEVTGQGLATHAARLVARFGFEHATLRRIRLFHAVGNVASGRVAQRVGFVREGCIRACLELHGADHDADLYSLTSIDEIREPPNL